MLLNAANYAIADVISLLGRIGLVITLLALTYVAYWKYHPSRSQFGMRFERKITPKSLRK